MHTGKLLFAQLMEHLPPMALERCVARDGGNYKVKTFSGRDQFLCMAFAQLTFRESQGDIEASLRSQAEKLYADEPFGIDLANTAYALDSTAIDLSLSLFP